MELSSYVPAWGQQIFYGVPVWIWAGLPALFVAIYVFSIVLGHGFAAIVNLATRRHLTIRASIDAVVPPLELLLAIALFKGGKQFFPLGKKAIHYSSNIELFLGTIAVGWLFVRLAQVVADRLAASFHKRGKRQAEAIIPLLRRLMKGAVAALTLLFLLQNMGFNVSAMLAGLGIGGVAIALASQKSVENLFGGVVLVLDQPIRVGDFGIYDKYMGTVEDVGLRSTRIRTLDRTIVTIPNGDFSQLKLESFTARDMLLFKTVLNLLATTTPEAMTRILEGLRALLKGDERVMPGFHVSFVNFGPSSYDVEIFSYINTANNDVFLVIREELMLKIIGIIQANGSDFANPSQTLYLESGASLKSEIENVRDAIKGTRPPEDGTPAA